MGRRINKSTVSTISLLLKLIILMKDKRMDAHGYAEELQVTTRTIYRYFKEIENAGFIVDKGFGMRRPIYFINPSVSPF